MSSLSRLPGAFALGALALACGARTNLGVVPDASPGDAGASFPIGTYTKCAFGTVTTGPFLFPSGFDDGATLTVTQSGDARTATFVDANGHSYSWTFATTTSASAVLAPSAQSADGFGNGICVYGIGVSNEKFFPTTFDASAGALTYDSGAMFVSLAGEVTSHAECGDMTAPASVWIGCTGGPAPAVSAPASATPFPAGDYACTSQIGTHGTLDGMNAFVTSGGTGALTLVQNGAQVSAHYAGDAELGGALDLTLDAAGTGSAIAGQSLTAQCYLDPTTADLPISAASLTAQGGTVFLSVAGTMTAGSACPGAEKIATLVCTKN